ncbi:MAG: hypothetical protein IT183_05725 [Acidobacteria bacterium]|nr:hypothetical protein [Acidobacteriota bacterium]
METELTTPENIDRFLQIASWAVVGGGVLWLVTSIVGVFYRGAYNLTHTESGSTKPVTPDFLKVDHAKRDAAVARGKAYDSVLTQREAQASTVKKACRWSRLFATAAALVTLFTAVIGAVEKAASYQGNIERYTTWDGLVELVTTYPIGTTVAVAVIAANVYMFVTKVRKPE